MKKHFLKPMTQFVLDRKEHWREKSMQENGNETYCRAMHSKDCQKYAIFLKRKLKREMFVLSDEAGVPLPFEVGKKSGAIIYQVGSIHIERAREKVLFEVSTDGKDYFLMGHNLIAVLELSETIEDLVTFKPFLTKSATNELGI